MKSKADSWHFKSGEVNTIVLAHTAERAVIAALLKSSSSQLLSEVYQLRRINPEHARGHDTTLFGSTTHYLQKLGIGYEIGRRRRLSRVTSHQSPVTQL